MLKVLRNKKTAKKIWLVLAIIIVPAFVFWGSSSLIRNREENPTLGRILGRNISRMELEDAFNAVRNQAIIQFGDKFSELQGQLNLESQAVERIILLEEAKRRRIKVSDQEVIGLIESYPFFHKKGAYDNRIYEQMLQYVFRTKPRAFEEQTRQNIMIFKLFDTVTKDATVSEDEIREAYEKENEEISVDYIGSTVSEFNKDVQVNEEEAKDYFNKNSLQFKEPLSFNLQYISVPETEEKEKTDELISKVSARLDKDEDLAKVASELGLTYKETGLFAQTEPIPEIGWSPYILNLISKAKVGDVTAPNKIDKNYYIFKLKERKEPFIPEFEAAKDKAKAAVAGERARVIAKEKIELCLKKLTQAKQNDPNASDLDKSAKECGLKFASSSPFKYGSYIEGIGASDNFWLNARLLKEGEFSSIIEMPSGFYIIKTKSRSPVDENKFTSEKETFRQKILNQKKQESFLRFFMELKRKAQS